MDFFILIQLTVCTAPLFSYLAVCIAASVRNKLTVIVIVVSLRLLVPLASNRTSKNYC